MSIVIKIFEKIHSISSSFGIVYYLLAIICLVLLIILVYVWSTPRGPNPFSLDDVRPPADLITDKAKRDAVLKQGFTSKKVPDKLDAIVIGSGIGSLTTAALLAKAGKKVLVLEQHDQAGGCCHTFIEKGFEFDVGIHYIGEMTNNTMTHVLVNQLTEGQLQFAPLDQNFDTVYIGKGENQKRIEYYAGRDNMKKGLKAAFPQEEIAIDKFFELSRKARKAYIGYFMIKVFPFWVSKFLLKTGLVHKVTNFFNLCGKSLTDVLDELTDNEELKAALSYSFGDYGTIPKDVPFVFHAVLFQHFVYGGFYPVGGASEIAFHIIPVIEKAGGKVLVRANVTQILLNESGKACGVRVTKGGSNFDIYASLVISGAGVLNTYNKLLPNNIRSKEQINLLLSKLKSGNAGICVFIGLKGSKEELGLTAKNHWIFSSPELNSAFEAFRVQPRDEVGKEDIPLLFVSFPSAKDPEWEGRFPGKSTCAIVTLGNWEWFEEWKDERVMKRGKEYEAIKNRIAERAWEQVCEMFPQLKDKREYFEAGSPLTNQYYIASPQGEIYGIDHNKTRFSAEVAVQLRPETPIPGLYITGQDVSSCGFSGAMYGGVITAAKVLNRNLLSDLIQLTVEAKKRALKVIKEE